MTDRVITCITCKKEKSDNNHVEHVRAHMREVYGSDECIRRGCDNQLEYTDGYCEDHHFEWIHRENARHFALVPYVGSTNDDEAHGVCSWNRDGVNCTEPRDRTDSGYCKEHRKQYAREYHRRRGTIYS